MDTTVETAAKDFRLLVLEFCEFLQEAKGLEKHAFLVRLFPALAKLVSGAASLPIVEPTSQDPTSIDVPPEEEREIQGAVGSLLGESDWYWENFDPAENSELVAYCLSLDLAEIYSDIRGVLLALEKGASANDAVWEWRFDFESHWGRHATSALRVVYSLLT